jgi:uncharacterized protein (TIGR02145 family)
MNNLHTGIILLVLIGYTSILKAQTTQSVKIKYSESGNYGVWMTKNLNTSKFTNGDLIQESKTEEQWIEFNKNKQPSWCNLYFNSENGPKYGKIYNWYAVNDLRGLCPIGWHIPTENEFSDLLYNRVENLKSTVGWYSYTTTHPIEDSRGILIGWRDRSWDGNGTNKTGFSGLPGGLIYKDGSFFSGSTGWWTSTEIDPTDSYFAGFESFAYSVKIKLFQNKDSIVKGEIQGVLSFVGGIGARYFNEGKRIKIFSESMNIPIENQIATTDAKGYFKFKNIPSGKYYFEIEYDSRQKNSKIPFIYDEIKGIQQDPQHTWVLVFNPDSNGSGLLEIEHNRGFYVRCVQDKTSVKLNSK